MCMPHALLNAAGPELVFCELSRAKFCSRQEKCGFGITGNLIGVKPVQIQSKTKQNSDYEFFLTFLT